MQTETFFFFTLSLLLFLSYWIFSSVLFFLFSFFFLFFFFSLLRSVSVPLKLLALSRLHRSILCRVLVRWQIPSRLTTSTCLYMYVSEGLMSLSVMIANFMSHDYLFTSSHRWYLQKLWKRNSGGWWAALRRMWQLSMEQTFTPENLAVGFLSTMGNGTYPLKKR